MIAPVLTKLTIYLSTSLKATRKFQRFGRLPTYSVLIVTLFIALVISLGVGAVPLTPAQVIAALAGVPVKASHTAIVWDFRLARILLVGVCGAALGASGAGFQGLFRNPLADPYIVGASGGAALGATLSAVWAGHSGINVPIGVAGFFGALAAVFIVYSAAESSGHGSVAALLLAGAAFSTMLSAVKPAAANSPLAGIPPCTASNPRQPASPRSCMLSPKA